MRDGHVLDGVVVAVADGADGQTMATGAATSSEDDVLDKYQHLLDGFQSILRRESRGDWGTHRARVDGQAVILVLNNGVADGHAVTLTNIKGIGVVATVRVTV